MVINRRLDPPLANDPDRVALDEPLILDAPLIRKIAATGKPMITSTGMATVAELDETVRAARQAGGRDLVLLKCTSTASAASAKTTRCHNCRDGPAIGCGALDW